MYRRGRIAQAAGVPLDTRRSTRRGRPTPTGRGRRRLFASTDAIAARSLRADGGRSAAMLFDKPEYAHVPEVTGGRSERLSCGHRGHAHSHQHNRTATSGRERARATRPGADTPVFIASPGPGGGGGGGGLRQRSRHRALSGRARHRSIVQYPCANRPNQLKRRRSPSRRPRRPR